MEVVQKRLEFDAAAMAGHIRRLRLPRRRRQLIEAVMLVGWQNRHERRCADGCFDSSEPPERFVGFWDVIAAKSQLRKAIGVSASTIKRALAAIPRDGFPPLLWITRGKNEAHMFRVDLSVIRTHEVHEVNRVQPFVNPVREPGSDPGSDPEVSRSPPMGPLGIGILKPSTKIPKEPIGSTIVWGRTLTDSDLCDLNVLAVLFPAAVVASRAKDSEQDWISFVALARYVTRQPRINSRPALFKSILENRSRSHYDAGKTWQSRPAGIDEDWALSALKAARHSVVDVDSFVRDTARDLSARPQLTPIADFDARRASALDRLAQKSHSM